ncbi:MAG: hypothetical protein M1840_008310 [Geoglossum simile]|nr:MAG: hypothetical protein M1840_008310 [Geoglossum simile]
MADPLNTVGLTIAIFDSLLKLGERTAVLISDVRAFDEDTSRLRDKIVDENDRTRLLRLLLFESASVYGGRTLFEQFDEDVQDQIKIFLVQLHGILHEGFDLLDRRYGSVSSNDPNSRITHPSTLSLFSVRPDPSSSTAIGSPNPTSRKQTASPLLLLRWSLRDKKRVEMIIRDFNDLNSRIHEKIKLCCLASTLGVNLPHLQRLRNDDTSKRLGFDVDATLRLTACDARVLAGTLELSDSPWLDLLRDTKVEEERFTVFTIGETTVLLENFYYDSDAQDFGTGISTYDPNQLEARTRNRVDALAKLLHQPKELVFRIPHCLGWKYVKPRKSIAFLFEMPTTPDAKPVSLLSLLTDKEVKPSLGDKFRLALRLAMCIAQLHMVKWVHESFRSENIVFLPTAKAYYKSAIGEIDYSQPWVLGFEFSRPEVFFSAGPADFCATRDVYRHPERQGQPEKPFTKIHDIYALGVVLLEIGLWEPAITLEKNLFALARDPYAVQSQLKKHASKRLESRVGEKYKNIVLNCLTGQFDIKDDTKEDLKLQQAFRTQVVEVLEMAANYV